jgi:hypothetical protein
MLGRLLIDDGQLIRRSKVGFTRVLAPALVAALSRRRAVFPAELAKEGRRENPASAILQVFDVVGREDEQTELRGETRWWRGARL